MSKTETNVLVNKPVNQMEHQELVVMKQQLNEMRYQLGLHEEQIKDLEQAKVQTHASIAVKRKEFTDRIIGISKSYGIKLGEVGPDGIIWRFDDGTLQFVPQKVSEPQAAPNAKPVEPVPPSNGSVEAKSDPVAPAADETN